MSRKLPFTVGAQNPYREGGLYGCAIVLAMFGLPFIVGIVILLCGILTVAIDHIVYSYIPLIIVILIGTIILVCCTIPFVILVRKYRLGIQLEREGQVIAGYIVSIERELQRDEDLQSHWIILYYDFQSPTGKSFQKKVRVLRDDLIDKPLPEIGTTISIKYLNDEVYRVI